MFGELTPAQRRARAEQKRQFLLHHLRHHAFTTTALAARLWGLKSYKAAWATLAAARRDGLVATQDLFGQEVWIPTVHGLAWFCEYDELPVMPPFPADRLAMDIALDTQRVALAADEAGCGWTPGYVLHTKIPDVAGFIELEAVFIERRFFNHDTYEARFDALSAAKFDEVLWVMPTRPLADRLARFLASRGVGFTQRFAALPDIELFFRKEAA